MRRLFLLLSGIVSRLLEPEEREFVLGDLSETAASSAQVLRQVCGLAIRRQAALWTNWRPWASLIGIALPSATLLRFASGALTDSSAIYLWLYSNYWSWTLAENAAYCHDLIGYIGVFGVCYALLFVFSWTAGLLLGYASRRSAPAQALLLTIVLFSLPAPHGAREVPGNAAVFAHAFFGTVFPLIGQAVFVLFPTLWGMRKYRSL